MPRHAACVYCVFPALCWEEAPSTLGSSPLARETFWNSNGSLCGMVEKSHWNISTQPSSTRPPPLFLSRRGTIHAMSQRGSTRSDTLISPRPRQLDGGRWSGWKGGSSGTVWHLWVVYTHTQKKRLEVRYLLWPSARQLWDTDRVPAWILGLSNLKRGKGLRRLVDFSVVGKSSYELEKARKSSYECVFFFLHYFNYYFLPPIKPNSNA